MDDDDTEFVSLTPEPPAKRARAKTGSCKECGKELSDARAAWCPEHRPTGAARIRKATGRKSKGGVSAAVETGMSETVGKVLLILTLAYAYSALRTNGIPDPNGDIADAMALTDDEAVMIGRPLARLFMSTEQGRNIAPKIVDNRDLIDAMFAAWDWYSRTNKVLAQYKDSYSVHTPMERTQNGTTGPVTSNEQDSGGNYGYVPGAPQDYLADV